MRGIYSYPMYGSANYGSFQGIHWYNHEVLPYNTMSSVCDNRINVDCIAVNDYNSDGNADILFGKVTCESVGVANDELWSYCDTLSRTFNSNNAWDPDSSYDTHAIQWVDYDADGELEIAALNFTSAYVHFYDYTPPFQSV